MILPLLAVSFNDCLCCGHGLLVVNLSRMFLSLTEYDIYIYICICFIFLYLILLDFSTVRRQFCAIRLSSYYN